MAENHHTSNAPTASANRDDFDEALGNANVIADIIGDLATHDLSVGARVHSSRFFWLAEELKARLERIKVVDMSMRRCRS